MKDSLISIADSLRDTLIVDSIACDTVQYDSLSLMKDSIVTDTLLTDTIPADTLPQAVEPLLPMILRADGYHTSSWFGILLIVVIVALAIAISVHRKQYALLLRNVLNKQGRFMSYDNEHTEVWANILLGAVVLMSYSMCIFSIARIKIGESLPVWVFLAINGAIFLLIFFKWIAVKIIAYVFSMREQANTFITDVLVLFAIFGLLLLPCAIGLVYSSLNYQIVWIFVVFALLIFAFISIVVKLLQIFYQGLGSLFYIFLYLCTLEILPISIVLKIVSDLVIKV